MANISRKLTINGWANLNDALIAAVAGYQGGRARSVRLTNLSATAVTVHANDSHTQPSDATQGTPIGSGATTTAVSNSLLLENVDIAGVWINTPSALDILVMILGM